MKVIRPLSRGSQGVRGIRLNENDLVLGMGCYMKDTCLLVVTQNGYGKRTYFDDFKVQSRAGKGVIAHKITEKTGRLADIKIVNESDDIMLISQDGTIIRMKVSEVNIISRNTQGVRLMRLSENNVVVSIARVINDDSEENEENIENIENIEDLDKT